MMIEIINKNKQLEVVYNDRLIIRQTSSSPFLLVGTGHEKIDFYRGNFDIDDSVDQKIPLEDYEIIGDEKILFSGLGYEVLVLFIEKNNQLHIEFDQNGREANRFWIQLYATEDEKVFGCGEQASYFNLRHRNFPLWTSEPGVGRDKTTLTTFYADTIDRAGGDYYTTYYPETTYISTRKYWCHAVTTAYAEYNFKNPNYHSLYFWDMPKELVIGSGKNFPQVIESLTEYTGRLPELPDWVHDGIILGLQGGTDQVSSYIEQAKAHDIEIAGVWCQDWVGINVTSFGKRLYWQWQWNQDRYPGLDKKIQELQTQGIQFLAYICPFFLENEGLYNRANKNDYLVLNKEGQPYIVDFGEFDCGIVDLTNPKAFEWYKNIIKTNLIELGIKGWMADFGEYLPIDCVLHNGVDPKLMHNEWPVLWAKCNYQAVSETGNLNKIIYFMRAGGFGSQKYCLSLWAGDQSVNWERHDGIPSVIPATLSSGMTGNPYNHSDIGGYTSLHGNIRTKELFQRWCEMAVFSAYMRTHEGNRPEENFQYYNDEDTMEHMSRMSKIRLALKPYIKSVVAEASLKGYPLQRPIFFHYEEDVRTYEIQESYLFGQDLLVAPVLKPETYEMEVYLPEDQWIHLWSGKEYNGGFHTVLCQMGHIPVFYKKTTKYKKIFKEAAKVNQ